MLDNRDRGREIKRVAMKRFSHVIGFVALAVFGACSLGAADFLTQAEIRARLDELYRPTGSNIVFGYAHVDHVYDTYGPFKAYEYHCPTCGESTWYRDKVIVGGGIDIAKYLAWARKSVEELRALRLDVHMDERTLCAKCRRELKIPDGGEIIRIPEVWPSWKGTQDVFPFAVGEKVIILDEPYSNVFGVARPNQTYWVRAKELEEAIERQDDRLIDVRMGPDAKYVKVMAVTRWAFGSRMPEVQTNGWARYQPQRSALHPLCFQIPKESLGNLTYAGAKTSRTDIFTPVWTINGKRIVVWESDVQLLKKFLTCERPRQDNELRVQANLLERLLNPKTIGDGKTKWYPSSCRKSLGPKESLSLTNDLPCEVEVEVDI